MSEKEKALIANIAKMPPKLKERFVSMAEGAAIAVECESEREADRESA